MKYLVLLRGVNVGGNNKISMTDLKKCLEALGYQDVATYINSGNAIFRAAKTAKQVRQEIETALPSACGLGGSIKALVISYDELQAVVAQAPKGFGQEPGVYHSDIVFLIDTSTREALKQTEVNPEVDTVWPGLNVIYYRRLSAKRTKSHLSKIVSKPVYKCMTIRTWNTATKLLERLQAM